MERKEKRNIDGSNHSLVILQFDYLLIIIGI